MPAGVGDVDIGTLSPHPVSRACNLEQNMKSRWNSLMVGGCNVVGLALLALSATAGGSAVRAGDPSTLQSAVLEKIVSGLEQQVANLGASVAAFADSFTAPRSNTPSPLCEALRGPARTNSSDVATRRPRPARPDPPTVAGASFGASAYSPTRFVPCPPAQDVLS